MSDAEKDVPTLYEWAGGMPVIQRWLEDFYERVRQDPIVAPIFANMKADHAKHVAEFFCEVLGGPATYSQKRGGHPRMVSAHLVKHLTPEQRRRWMQILFESADSIGLPSDPEFRSAIVAYVEWGSRLAVINSQDGATVDPDAAMPKWGWGIPGGPYQPPAAGQDR
jgi:hemoglobin